MQQLCVRLSTLSSAVSLSVNVFPAHPAERFVQGAKWEGDGEVDQGVFTMDVSGKHHQSRAELGPMPTWVVRMVTGVVLGSGR